MTTLIGGLFPVVEPLHVVQKRHTEGVQPCHIGCVASENIEDIPDDYLIVGIFGKRLRGRDIQQTEQVALLGGWVFCCQVFIVGLNREVELLVELPGEEPLHGDFVTPLRALLTHEALDRLCHRLLLLCQGGCDRVNVLDRQR